MLYRWLVINPVAEHTVTDLILNDKSCLSYAPTLAPWAV